ncbi:hypothetical protein Ccrd_001540 [Cynara cardunculus var. scolymus]|uniref:Bulb-type lectin domain-containing protein n=1 Tax=Cynara cardunculus var. scolymus TaxID=59895 RepID=A0A103XT34_CYNCS|nr:hypothetical protein Ccrd_001540 [Cynara cardunculus var. scolymus]
MKQRHNVPAMSRTTKVQRHNVLDNGVLLLEVWLVVTEENFSPLVIYDVGENAYGFAVWFRKQSTTQNRTMVWMANRDALVNRKHSKLSLQEDGDLVLIDAGQYVIWSTNTKSTSSSVELQLLGIGNSEQVKLQKDLPSSRARRLRRCRGAAACGLPVVVDSSSHLRQDLGSADDATSMAGVRGGPWTWN